MSKNKGGKIGAIFVVLLLIYIAFAILDFCGIFVKGSYSGKDNDYDITLGTMGRVFKPNGEVDDTITYRTVGKEIYFYSNNNDNKQPVICVLQNGVISVQIEGQIINVMYKDGDYFLDGTKKSFFDYVRIVVAPLSELIYNIAN